MNRPSLSWQITRNPLQSATNNHERRRLRNGIRKPNTEMVCYEPLAASRQCRAREIRI